MATVERQFATFNGDTAQVRYAYDDVSLLILSVTLVNNGPAGTVFYTARDRTTQAVVSQGSRPFASGTQVFDVSGLAAHMVMVAGKGGVSAAQLPFDLSAAWSSA